MSLFQFGIRLSEHVLEGGSRWPRRVFLVDANSATSAGHHPEIPRVGQLWRVAETAIETTEQAGQFVVRAEYELVGPQLNRVELAEIVDAMRASENRLLRLTAEHLARGLAVIYLVPARPLRSSPLPELIPGERL